MVDISTYKVGIVVASEDCKTKGKALKACTVRVDPNDENQTISVVTSATNVREGSRIVVAPVGTIFIDDEGEERTVQKATVGGAVSEGMFCDSTMLGWSGGAKGIAVQIPDSFDIGAAPPSAKPRRDLFATTAEAAAAPSKVKGLFEKKLTKEEKKKLAEEKRKARKEAKASRAKDSADA